MKHFVTALVSIALIVAVTGCASLNREAGSYVVVEKSAAESREVFGFWNFNGSPANEVTGGEPLLLAYAPVGGHFVDDRENREFFENTKYHLTKDRLISEFRPEVHPDWEKDSSNREMKNTLINQYIQAYIPVPEINLDMFTVAFRLRLGSSSKNYVDSEGNPVGRLLQVLHMGFVGHPWIVYAIQDGPSGPFTLQINLNDSKRDESLQYDTDIIIPTDTETEIVLSIDNYEHTLKIYKDGELSSYDIKRIREWGHCPSGGTDNTTLRLAPFVLERMEFDWLTIMNGTWNYTQINDLKDLHLEK